jgi:hypothetical protein
MTPARYRWSSLVIESAVPLPELHRCDSAQADLHFDSRIGRESPARVAWAHRWLLPNRARWLSIASVGEERLLRFERLADFVISADGRTIRCDARRTTTPETVRHLLLDQVLPAMLAGERRFGVHASAVAVDGAAVAFLGRTGRGKSTLAAAFGLRGAPIVTDDCLVFELSPEGVVAVPTYPSLRLAPAALERLGTSRRRLHRVAQYTAKLRLGADNAVGLRFRQRPISVSRLYLLERDPRARRPRIRPLSRRESYMELMKYRFRLDPRDRTALRRECDQLARLAFALPMARLYIPSGFAALPRVRDAVLADIRGTNRP